MKVTKRDGRVVDNDRNKIIVAIWTRSYYGEQM